MADTKWIQRIFTILFRVKLYLNLICFLQTFNITYIILETSNYQFVNPYILDVFLHFAAHN